MHVFFSRLNSEADTSESDREEMWSLFFFLNFWTAASFFLRFIYFAVMGLCCCAQASPSFGKPGLLCWGDWAHCGGLSCCGAQALGHMGISSRGKWFSCSTARGIFLDQGWNLVPCIARPILHHWTTREAPTSGFISSLTPSRKKEFLEAFNIFSSGTWTGGTLWETLAFLKGTI